MRVVSIGIFLLPMRFSLAAVFDGGKEKIQTAIRTALSDFRPTDGFTASELLLDYHRSLGAQQMECVLFSGITHVDNVGPVELYVSSLSIGFVIVQSHIPDGIVDLEAVEARSDFKSHETPISMILAPHIEQWASDISRAVSADATTPRPSVALPQARLLWWHRIAVNPRADLEFPAARWYGVSAELANGARCVVGNGFTNLRFEAGNLSGDVVADVVNGIILATQEWLIVDEAKRLLADHLMRLSESRTYGLLGVEEQYVEVLMLTEEITLRNLLLHEEARYLANARKAVKNAAGEAWGTATEVAELEHRAAALRNLFELHRERIASHRDDRRNRYIFAFTGLTFIQASLLWYDFLTADDVTVSTNPRPTIAIMFLAVCILILCATVASVPVLRMIRSWHHYRYRSGRRNYRFYRSRRTNLSQDALHGDRIESASRRNAVRASGG